MVILDTSIWIEFFRTNSPFYRQVSKLLDHNEVLAFSPIFGELLQGAKSNFERSVITDFWNYLPKINEYELFVRSGAESSRHKLFDKGIGLIDCVILLGARETSSFVWTLDNKLGLILKKEEKYIPQ